MSWRVDVRLAGSGGQGLALAATVLAEGALVAGHTVTVVQNHGPEARGGSSRSDLALSDGPIANPECPAPDLWLVLHQRAWDRFVTPEVTAGRGTVLVDGDRVETGPVGPGVIPLPFEAIARDELGAKVVANMLAVGALGCLLDRIPLATLRAAAGRRSPAAFARLNEEAVERGWSMMVRARAGAAGRTGDAGGA